MRAFTWLIGARKGNLTQPRARRELRRETRRRAPAAAPIPRFATGVEPDRSMARRAFSMRQNQARFA
jgi:hypothetical protein